MIRFIQSDRDQPFLLPPDLRDWIPNDHLCHFIVEAVNRVDINQFKINHRGTGSEQYDPRVMLALLIYCYANRIFASRRIESATHFDVIVRFVAANKRQSRPCEGPARRRRGLARLAPLTGGCGSNHTWRMQRLVAQEQHQAPGLLLAGRPVQALENTDGTAYGFRDGPWKEALQHGPLHRRYGSLSHPTRHRLTRRSSPGAGTDRHSADVDEDLGKASLSWTGARGMRLPPRAGIPADTERPRSHPMAPPRTADLEVLQVFALTIECCKAGAFLRPTRHLSPSRPNGKSWARRPGLDTLWKKP